MPGAEAFFYPAGQNGCLLIHGISGSPQVMKQMGEYLSGEGITTLGVRLAGHGTRVEDLYSITYQDWIKSAEDGLSSLKQHCRNISCAGLSLGGVIALQMCCLYPEDLSGVIPICSPYKLSSLKYKFVPLLKKVIKKIPAGSGAINDPGAEQVNYSYHSVSAVHELMKLTAVVREKLPLIRQPALLFAARHDRVINRDDPALYYEKLASDQKELIWLEHAGHVATLDYDKEIMFEKSAQFIDRVGKA